MQNIYGMGERKKDKILQILQWQQRIPKSYDIKTAPSWDIEPLRLTILKLHKKVFYCKRAGLYWCHRLAFIYHTVWKKLWLLLVSETTDDTFRVAQFSNDDFLSTENQARILKSGDIVHMKERIPSKITKTKPFFRIEYGRFFGDINLGIVAKFRF